MSKKLLQLQQIDSKMQSLVKAKQMNSSGFGWIKAIRSALGMSMQQLGNKLSISKQGILDFEKRELDGAVTIKSMREIGRALEMEFVYGFVPIDTNLNALIERKAKELATEIVMRTSTTMKLENQENSKKRIQKAIVERTELIKNEMPKILWD